jgi:5'-nucleotidase
MDRPAGSEPDRPLILCANDDGYFSKGLRAAALALSSFAHVVVVAPETEQSATSHSLTLHRPLRLRRIAKEAEVDTYALDGTPADCVYLALHLGFDAIDSGAKPVLPRKPDLVVSGINRGLNLGQDVFYSGTVAAAREGALRGIPSLAASLDVIVDESGTSVFDPAPTAQLVASIAREILSMPKSDGPAFLFNLNVPTGPVKGLAATRLGTRLWTQNVEARVDPRGRAYYWIGGRGIGSDQVPGSDTEAHDAGLASLSVLGLDLARHDEVARSAAERIVRAVTG